MTRRIMGINGIRSDGDGNTDVMLARLQELGHKTIDTSYPLTNLLRARSRAHQISDARLLIDRYHQDGDTGRSRHPASRDTCTSLCGVIAHSRGCLVNLRMMEQGAKFGTVFWFRPAMNRDYIIPPGACERLFVIHSPGDRAIWLGERLWWHDFGGAGRRGLYAGDHAHDLYDPRVKNILAPRYQAHEFWRHSDDFLPQNIDRWVKFIDELLNNDG